MTVKAKLLISIDEFKLRLGHRVVMLRTDKRMSQFALSQETQVTQATLSKIEKGKAMPTLVTLRKIALALEVSTSDLIPDDK
jgi:transcriptional regulator with XRE-family HTH domain